jgi:hypothetical protein
MNRTQINNVYSRYKQSVNMSYSELLKWSQNPCSKKASIGNTAINRNLMLLKTPKEQWTVKHATEALKSISFNTRMSKVNAGDIIKGCGISKRTISLKNWALDPNKK